MQREQNLPVPPPVPPADFQKLLFGHFCTLQKLNHAHVFFCTWLLSHDTVKILGAFGYRFSSLSL